MAGRTDLKSSTLINVVDLSLIEFENVYENQLIIANIGSHISLTQKGDSGYPLWRTDQVCKHLYQVSLHFLHMLIAHHTYY